MRVRLPHLHRVLKTFPQFSEGVTCGGRVGRARKGRGTDPDNLAATTNQHESPTSRTSKPRDTAPGKNASFIFLKHSIHNHETVIGQPDCPAGAIAEPRPC